MVTIDQIRERAGRKPFVPFGLKLDDGRRLRIVGRRYLLIAPGGTEMFVCAKSGSLKLGVSIRFSL